MGRLKEYDLMVDEYIDRVLDGVDVDTLYDLAFTNMKSALNDLPIPDVITMIEEQYPELLEGTAFEGTGSKYDE